MTQMNLISLYLAGCILTLTVFDWARRSNPEGARGIGWAVIILIVACWPILWPLIIIDIVIDKFRRRGP